MAIDALQGQLASALQRLHTLQRRAETSSGNGVLTKALAELENALEEVRVAQEQLLENRHRMEELQAELTRQYQKYWELFDDMPQPYVVTRPDSSIIEANRAASEMFNVSQRFLVGKTLSVFVAEDRGRFLETIARIAETGGELQLQFRLRPRERAPFGVQARIGGDRTALRWIISQIGATAAASDLSV